MTRALLSLLLCLFCWGSLRLAPETNFFQKDPMTKDAISPRAILVPILQRNTHAGMVSVPYVMMQIPKFDGQTDQPRGK